LEKTSKIIESNHPLNTTVPTKPCPEVPQKGRKTQMVTQQAVLRAPIFQALKQNVIFHFNTAIRMQGFTHFLGSWASHLVC